MSELLPHIKPCPLCASEQVQLFRDYNNRANIQKVIDGKRKTHGGFYWADAAIEKESVTTDQGGAGTHAA